MGRLPFNDLRRFVRLLWPYVWPQRRWVLLLVAGSYLATGLAMIGPFLMAAILSVTFATTPATSARFDLTSLSRVVLSRLAMVRIDRPMSVLVLLSGAYVVVAVMKSWVDYANLLLAMRIRVRAALDLQRDLFRHVLSLSLGFFTRERSSEVATRLESDTHTVTGSVESILCTWLTAPMLVAFYGMLLIRTNSKLALAAGAALLLHAAVTRGLKGALRPLASQHAIVYGEVAARLHEAVLSIRVVKALAVEVTELRRLATATTRALRAHLAFSAYKHAEEPARSAVNALIEGTLVLLAAREFMAGRLDAPTFFLFLYVGRAVMTPVAHLAATVTQIYVSLGVAARIFTLLEEQPQIQDGTRHIAQFREAIRLEGVSFSYQHRLVVEEVSFEVKRGEMVALVGVSGVGKSTIADLILRLYDPTTGRITIDGIDLRELSQRSYRRLFGVVPQEALLFNTTVRHNITYGLEAISEEATVRAARLANAHDFIVELPDGYDTVVGDRGIRLSGGQRQRIAIARAIVSAPPILVLDEATSFLDAEAERLVQDAIERVTKGTTAIIVAHRLTTIVRADKIVVLNDGRVEAIGRHDALMQANGTYARLFDLSTRTS